MLASKKIKSADLLRRLQALPQGQRYFVAIAGVPGSGKSTLATAMVDGLNAMDSGRAAVLGMDGYHYDNSVLTTKGRLLRKGAPDTFDVDGLASLLSRLRENKREEIAIPVFDRSIEIARVSAAIVKRSVDIIVVEGNYLLSDRPPWTDLQSMFDLRVLLYVSQEEILRRLRQRWIFYGLDEEGIRRKLEDNDLPNGQYVLERSTKIDLIVDGEA